MNLQQPFTDLRATVTRPIGALTPNGKAAGAVTIINDGNVKISQNVTIQMNASTDQAADPSDASIVTITKRVSISPGKSKNVPIKFTFPASLAAGTYFVTATLDPLGEIVETSKSNNTAITDTPITFG